MGDVDALCKRIIIIDKGKVLYDNDIESLKKFFGAYRTLKVSFGREVSGYAADDPERSASDLQKQLDQHFPGIRSIPVTVNEEWIDILVNEDDVPMMEVLNYIQGIRKINDMSMQEITTESIIKKIYERGIQ
jgi:ABC-2 type transport system ATP-binding protein